MRALDAELAAGGGPIVYDQLWSTPWRRIVLSERHDVWCLVDAKHYDWLMQWRWNWGWHNRTPWKFYAKRNVGLARSTLYLHRELLKEIDPRGYEFEAVHQVDHKNGNSLDNREENLRWLTPAENRANRRPRERIPSLDKILAGLLSAAPALEEPPF